MTSDTTAPDVPSVSGTRPATRIPGSRTTSGTSRTPLRRLTTGLGTVLLCLGTLLFVLPFLFTVVTSLRTAADVARSRWASRTR